MRWMWRGRTAAGGKRTRQATALAVLVLVGMLAVAGFVLAGQGPPPGVPEHIETAAPRIGDHGAYEVAAGDGASWPSSRHDGVPEGARLEAVTYTEAGYRHVVDRAGEWRAADRIEETRRWSHEDGRERETRWSHDLSSGRAQPLAHTRHIANLGGFAMTGIYLPPAPVAPPAPVPQPLPNETVVGQADVIHQNRDVTAYDRDNTLFCGHRHTAQGRGVAHDTPLVAYGACDVAATRGDPSGTRFDLVGLDRLDGMDVVAYARRDDPDAARIWLHPDFPVPVRIEFGTGQELVVMELVAFDRGTEPLLPRHDPPLDTAAVTMTSADQWGPDPGAFPVPWRIEDAFAAARDHPDHDAVRTFLRDHPDAIIVAAVSWSGLDEQDEPDERVLGWDLVLGDTDTGLLTNVTKRTPTSPVEGLQLPPALQAAAAEVEVTTERIDGRFPASEQLPNLMPAPYTVYARMVAINASVASEGAEAYGFAHTCDDDDCTSVTSQTLAGRAHRTWPEPSPAGLATASVQLHALNLLRVGSDGASIAAEQNEPYHRDTGVAPGFDRELAASTSFAAVGGAFRFHSWAPPEPEVGFVLSLISILIGLLYRFWPWLQALPIFSVLFRTPGEDVLDNDVRRRIHDVVQDEPGIHYSALMRRVGHGNHVVRHHLDRLIAARMVVERQGGRFACYFPPGTADRRVLDAAPVLKSGNASAVLRGIIASPGVSGRELAGALGVAPGTVSYHTKRLEEAGLVQVTADGRHRRFRATALAGDALGAVRESGAAA